MALLPDLGTEIVIPMCAVIGIAFSLVQWIIVSRVKLTPDRSGESAAGKNGYGDYLIEEEEGTNDQNVVVKCAEIQSAISEGLFPLAYAVCDAENDVNWSWFLGLLTTVYVKCYMF